ncbi:hypothetical protein Taro_039487, partial [Colocasia esculenta]|nr:hypothetical protein [Colocasia esculenta]
LYRSAGHARFCRHVTSAAGVGAAPAPTGVWAFIAGVVAVAAAAAMEVSLESFSIREYTARMRRVDASKCWPFDGEARGNQLPPIERRRYRWWSSELQIARSGDACERRAGAPERACGRFVSCADATVVPGDEEEGGGERPRLTTDEEPVGRHAVLVLPGQASCAKEDDDGDEDGRLARSPGKAKAKTPKKRSILELFAVAPQIDAVEDEAEGDDDDEVLAVDKDSKEHPKHDEELREDTVEEPRNRKEESVETLMRKKIKNNCEKKKKDKEDKMKKKKTKMMMRKKKQKLLKKQKKQKNSIKIGVAEKTFPVCFICCSCCLMDMDFRILGMNQGLAVPECAGVASFLGIYGAQAQSALGTPADQMAACLCCLLPGSPIAQCQGLHSAGTPGVRCATCPPQPPSPASHCGHDRPADHPRTAHLYSPPPGSPAAKLHCSSHYKAPSPQLATVPLPTTVSMTFLLPLLPEKIYKHRLQSPVDFARLLHDSVIMKRLGKEIGVPALAQGRKPAREKSALKENKVKGVQASKSKKQLSESKHFHIHSILRNQKKVASTGLGKVHIIDGSHNGDGNCVQQSDKHVHFSGKDDILGNHERHFFPLGSPPMQSLCKVFSDVLAASSVMDEPSEGGNLSECSNKSVVVTANEDTASDCADIRKTGEPLPFQQLTDIQDVTNTDISAEPQGNHVEKKTTLDDSLDLNNSVQDHYDIDQIDPCPTEPLSKDMNSKLPEGCDLCQVLDDPGNETREIDTNRGLSSGPAAVITVTDVVRNSNSELGTCSLLTDMVANKSNCQFYPVEKNHKDVYTYDSQFQSSHLLKRGMMSTVYSDGSMRQLYQMDHIPESRLNANPEDIFHGKATSRNVFGLPLNSQGEYIHLQSGAQIGFDQLFKKQNMMLGPVSSFLVHSSVDPSYNNHTNVKGKVPLSSAYVENQKKWIPEKGFSRDQSIVMPISGFGELQDISQTGVRSKESSRKFDHFVSNLNVEANLYRVPCHGFREQNQPCTHRDRAMAELEGASEPHFHSINQPTMRLMGKNFIVGRQENNKEHQGSSGSQIWADKRMLVDLHPTLRMCEEAVPKHWPGPEWAAHHPSGTSYENVIHTLETQNKPNVSNFYHLTCDPRPDNAQLDYGIGVLSSNSCQSINFGRGYKPDTFNHPHAHEAWVSKASMSKKNHGCESEYLKMGFQSPLAVCNSENVCQHLLLNSTHCKHSQSLSHSMTSTFPSCSSFEDPDNVNYVQLPSAQGSSQRLPHWLVSAGQKRNTSNSSALSFHDSVSKHEPCMKSGTSIFPLSSPPITSIQHFPSLGQSSHACFSDLPSPASLVHSSLYPPFPAAKSGSTNGTCYWTMCSNRDDMQSKYSFLQSEYTNKTRKRSAPCSNDLLTAMKRPNLYIQGDSGSLVGSKKGEETHACAEHNPKMLELRSGDKNMANDVVKEAHAPGTSKLDIGSRTRPVKLSAGAKHILKPSLHMDQDNSMPVHSTIPFSRATNSGMVPASQKKPTKIYQF